MVNIFKCVNQRAWVAQWFGFPAVAALAYIALSSPASAQCLPNELQKLAGSDATQSDHFGVSVSISGNLAVVGAKNAGDLANSGAVYIYRLKQDESGWIEEQRLVALDAEAQDQFGFPVAIDPLDPNVIIVGAWADDDACPENVWCQSGAAYIFRYNPDSELWVQEQKLTASDADSYDYFGWAVSIWGDVAMVGAKLDEDPDPDTGSVYVFRYDPETKTWQEQQKLIPSDWEFYGRFGNSISLQNNTVIIGASSDSEQDFIAGAAYVYTYDPNSQLWIEKQKLLPLDPGYGANFGNSVSLSGDFALIGAQLHSVNGVGGAGAVYVFENNGAQWIERQKLTAAIPGYFNTFGRSVSLQDNIAVIGTPTSDDFETDAGSVSIFVYNPETLQWSEQATLHSSDLEIGDLFGGSVSIDGARVIIGARWDDDDGTESGSAYIFGGLGDCNNNGIIDICDIADGNATDKNNNGQPDECDKPPCPWDLDGSGSVGTGDLLALFTQWGTKGSADFNADGIVSTADLLILFTNWGPC